MPLSVPLAACLPMLTDTVELSAVSRTRGRTVTARCRASVSAPGTVPGEVVTAPSAWQWTVELAAQDWPAGDVAPSPGATIAPGPRWPRLSVTAAWPMGPLWHLECSSREAPR